MKPDDRAIERLDGTRKGRPRRHRLSRGEGGMVLPVSLLIITVLSILGTAFLAMSLNENVITRWNRDVTQSLYLADLGIERSMNQLNQLFDADMTKSDLDAELATNGGYLFGSSSTYVALDLPLPGGGTYQAGQFRVRLTNNTDGGVGSDDQDRAAWATADGRVTVGGKTRNKQVVALLSPVTPSAITFGCPTTGTHTLTISGNPALSGTKGSLHSNCNVDIDGNPTFTDDLTASGTIDDPLPLATVGGTRAQGVPRVTVPTVNPATFKPLADYIMVESTGPAKAEVRLQDGTLVATLYPGGAKWPGPTGWEYSGAPGFGGKWVYGSADMYAQTQQKTFYFQKPAATAGGHVIISGSPGTPGNEWQVTVLAEGHIDVSGSPLVRADSQNLLLVAGTDIKIGGNYTSSWPGGAIIAAHEQMDISGNPELTGMVIIENAAATDSYVTLNAISGNPEITYSGAPAPPAAWYPIRILAWREVRG